MSSERAEMALYGSHRAGEERKNTEKNIGVQTSPERNTRDDKSKVKGGGFE